MSPVQNVTYLSGRAKAANWLAHELAELGVAFVEIGDGVAPRQAPYAFYEGRVAGTNL
ncbi:hypothetical protein ABIE78_006681 [Sinorhizobium fredii]|jgi:hypothetical protein|uniref:hypothetical protein n=1 Tax=Rhizobium fredii TaxID=380 RepID=UPI00030E65BC|nr:hypothetical protein [Sinorhizobium fredii]